MWSLLVGRELVRVSFDGLREIQSDNLKRIRCILYKPQRKEFGFYDLIDDVRACDQILKIRSDDQFEGALRYVTAIHDCWIGW